MNNLIFYPDAFRDVIPAATVKKSLVVRIKLQRTRTAEDSSVVAFPNAPASILCTWALEAPATLPIANGAGAGFVGEISSCIWSSPDLTKVQGGLSGGWCALVAGL